MLIYYNCAKVTRHFTVVFTRTVNQVVQLCALVCIKCVHLVVTHRAPVPVYGLRAVIQPEINVFIITILLHNF